MTILIYPKSTQMIIKLNFQKLKIERLPPLHSIKRIQYKIILIKDLMRQVDHQDKFMKCLIDLISWRRT